MPSKARAATRRGYELEKVTIRQLFASGETHEPSEKALRDRAGRRHGILVFVESVGNAHYYDRLLSVIRVNAARRCKGPGVQWEDISDCLKQIPLSNDGLKALLNDGHSTEQVTATLAEQLSSFLDRR